MDEQRYDLKIRYHVCFVKDGKEYVWEMHHKTYGGARRYISNSGWWIRFDGWYIERVKSWMTKWGVYQCSGVIIAQMKDIVIHNRFKQIA